MHKLFTRQAEASIPTSIGTFRLVAFASDPNDYAPHLAIISEKKPKDGIYNVRLHSECLTGDILGSKRCDCGEQLEMSLAYIAQHGGVILYLRQEGRGIGLINKLKAYALQDKGLDTVEANVHLGFEPDERSYELAMAMLEDLGVDRIRILTNNPDKVEAFNDSEIEIVERIPVEVMPNEINAEYLRVKKDVMGHILGEED